MEKEVSQNQTLKKKKLCFWLVIFVIIGLLCLGLIYYLAKIFSKPEEIPEVQPEEKTLQEKQLEELDALRQNFRTEPFSEEEIQKQLEDLDKLSSRYQNKQ